MKDNYEGRFTSSKSFGDMGFGNSGKVIVDTETGVQYLFISAGYGGGLCTIVDRDGKPMLADNAKARL